MKKLKQIKHELHNALCCGSFTFAHVTLSREEKAERRRLKKDRPFKVSDIKRTPFTVSFNMSYPDGTKLPVDLLIILQFHKLPSYATELLVIKSYEDFNRPEPGGITEEKMVTAVFDSLRDCSNIKIHWNTNYNLMDHQQPSGPYIMDPANPYHNLFSQKTEEYWIRHNETENIVLSDPDFSRLERDAARTMQRLQ